MDNPHKSHAVARTAAVIQAAPPECFPRQNVDMHARASRFEHRARGGNVTLEHKRIRLPLLVRQRAQRIGTRDVRGAVPVLPAAVHQQEPARLQLRAGILHGGIVHHSRVCPIGRDGFKACAQAVLLRHSQARQIVGCCKFRPAFPCFHTAAQLHLEPNHRRAVPAVRLFLAGYLCFILYGFEQLNGVFTRRERHGPVLAQRPQEGPARTRRLIQKRHRRFRRSQKVPYIPIRMQRYSLRLQHCLYPGGHAARVNEQMRPLRLHQAVSERKRVVLHIVRTQVQ